jgi:hypothetical protein
MKSADFTLAGMPSERSEGVRRPGQSQVRAKLRHARANALPDAERRAVRSAPPSLSAAAPRRAPAESSAQRASGHVRSREEPSTGVVQRIDPARTRSVPAPGVPQERRPTSKGDSQVVRREDAKRESAAERHDEEDLRAWRCLEWGQPPREERPRRNPKVTIVQLSASGELVRQNGPDAWLPEAGDFMHRMSTLVARGLGFERCRSICLKAPTTALAVSEANEAKIMVVSGSHRSLANVLRRAGLE